MQLMLNDEQDPCDLKAYHCFREIWTSVEICNVTRNEGPLVSFLFEALLTLVLDAGFWRRGLPHF